MLAMVSRIAAGIFARRMASCLFIRNLLVRLRLVPAGVTELYCRLSADSSCVRSSGIRKDDQFVMECEHCQFEPTVYA